MMDDSRLAFLVFGVLMIFLISTNSTEANSPPKSASFGAASTTVASKTNNGANGNGKGQGTSTTFKTRLIHRDRIITPKEGTHDTNGMTRSPFTEEEIQALLIPNDNGITFFVNISIGEPPVPQLLVMDSGSSLTWVQCSSCIGCGVQLIHPLFDPSKSSTYDPLYCAFDGCDYTIGGSCGSMNLCSYHLSYGSGDTTCDGS